MTQNSKVEANATDTRDLELKFVKTNVESNANNLLGDNEHVEEGLDNVNDLGSSNYNLEGPEKLNKSQKY
jgi:hypothetical protein